MNTQRIGGDNDYLAMFNPPDFESISSPPTYVNDDRFSFPEGEQPARYLCMKPAHVFSPREAEEGVFSFDVPAGRQADAPGNGELVPMLHTLSESDTEAPVTPLSVANPSYLMFPKNGQKEGEICKTADNYVNMPQNKCSLIGEGLAKDGGKNGARYYVNGNIVNQQQTCL